VKALFVDTAAWMAMADANDPHHAACTAARDHWMAESGILLTSNYVIDETLTLIRMRLGIGAAEKWWEPVSESPRCRIEWISPDRAHRAIRWFFKWRDQSFSCTDCTSFGLMRELGLGKALTTDRHFIAAGFQVQP
jgi:uncharacterized protein